MKNEDKEIKMPISDDMVFRNMMIAVYAVAALFLGKNLISGNLMVAAIIGVCMFLFFIITFTMKKKNVTPKLLQLILCFLLKNTTLDK